MKIKKLIIIVVILIISILFYILFMRKNGYVGNNNDAKLLAINTYSNYATGIQFYGTAIFDNGYIYIWREYNNSNTKNYKIGTIEGLEEYILNEAKIKIKKVSNNDLEQIKELVSKIEDNIKITYPGADQGTNTIAVINEKNNEIVLKESGDSVGENYTKEAQELLKLIEKYL